MRRFIVIHWLRLKLWEGGSVIIQLALAFRDWDDLFYRMQVAILRWILKADCLWVEIKISIFSTEKKNIKHSWSLLSKITLSKTWIFWGASFTPAKYRFIHPSINGGSNRWYWGLESCLLSLQDSPSCMGAKRYPNFFVGERLLATSSTRLFESSLWPFFWKPQILDDEKIP